MVLGMCKFISAGVLESIRWAAAKALIYSTRRQ